MTENINVWQDWQIVRKLGEGGFGKVYEIVRNRYSIEEHRALKRIRIPSEDSDVKRIMSEGMDESGTKAYYRSLVDEFIKEIAFLSQLRGAPNIVTYDDYKVVERDNGMGWDIFIMMELLTPLPDILAQHSLEEAEVKKLGVDISNALRVCHSKNILHRDIKADNIFVTKEGVYKLGDFGIARTVEKTSAAHTRIGTSSYIAPETYRGQRYDSRADLYSLGILLYRLLNNNRNPFLPPYPQPVSVQDRDEALEKRLTGVPLPRPAHGSDALVSVVLKACAFRPEDRFASAEQLKQAIANADDSPQRAVRPFDLTQIADEPYNPTPASIPQNSIPPRSMRQQPPPYRSNVPLRSAPRGQIPPQRQGIPQGGFNNYPQPEEKSSGISAGIAVVIILIVLVLIGGGITIFAIMNRDSVDDVKTDQGIIATQAPVETAPPPTEPPAEKSVTFEFVLPENNTGTMQMKVFLSGEELESYRAEISDQKAYTFTVPIRSNETFTVTLDDSTYYSCTLDYESGSAINENYHSDFYSPNVAG